MDYLDLPHHDGSPLYVSTPAPALGETVTVWARVPVDAGVTGVHVRSTPDAEPRFATAEIDVHRTGAAVGGYGRTDVWWRADLAVRNPVTRYRFLFESERAPKFWLTAAGVSAGDLPDDNDFRLVAHQPPPRWTDEAVVYEIFPDRFARSAASGPLDPGQLPDWAMACDWDRDEVIPHGPQTPHQVFGGDLDGIIEHLDHIEGLGANTIYLRPVFPARSNHRYDASTFDWVDPLVGGDAALERLAKAVHERGMRLIGDITTNHCGAGHTWFRTARRDPLSPDRSMFYFDADGGYESWYDVPSLPKLNWQSPVVVERMSEAVRRWLPLYDGWRVDVANMTGRHGDIDINHDVARLLCAQIREQQPEAMIIAEHNHDAAADLDQDGWQGTMNYAGFTRPVWTWLRGDVVDQEDFIGEPGGVPRRGGRDVARTMRAFASRLSWRSLTHSWQILDSFDVARIRTITGSPARHLVAAGLQMTLPGTPMICAGSEFGLTGDRGEGARTPMPWNRPHEQDEDTRSAYERLVGVRTGEPALRRGGLRWVYVADDTLVYLRETETESLLMAARRSATDDVDIRLDQPITGVYRAADHTPVDGILTLPGTNEPTFSIWRVGAAG